MLAVTSTEENAAKNKHSSMARSFGRDLLRKSDLCAVIAMDHHSGSLRGGVEPQLHRHER